MSGTVSPKANYERILAKAVTEILPFTLDVRFFRNHFKNNKITSINLPYVNLQQLRIDVVTGVHPKDLGATGQ